MDPLVGQLLSPQYSMGTAALSYLISFFGALAALLCARKMVRADGSLDFAMLCCAAVALGGVGIWSMHFIAMVAYRLPISIAYNIPLTVISLVAAIVISGIALYMAGGKKFNKRGWLGASLLAGVGVCVMHYLGMYAMNMRATMTLDPMIVAASAVIAISAAAAALWLAFNLSELTHQLVAAAVMAVAVCTMHYVGMSAASMVCTTAAPVDAFLMGGRYIGLSVFGISGGVLLFIAWVATERTIENAGARPMRATRATPRHS